MKNKHTSPWAWIPTLYFAQGLPYVAVMTISVIMYKKIRHQQYRISFLYRLAQPALGYQASMEPFH